MRPPDGDEIACALVWSALIFLGWIGSVVIGWLWSALAWAYTAVLY